MSAAPCTPDYPCVDGSCTGEAHSKEWVERAHYLMEEGANKLVEAIDGEFLSLILGEAPPPYKEDESDL
jgi:hypothetical protein